MKPSTNCPICDCTDWVIKLRVNRDGRVSYPNCCDKCGHASAICEKKETVIELISIHKVMPEVIVYV